MGADAASSVVDRDCKAHQIDNLYVVDTSVFVTSAAVNPTLTTVANAMRVGDHLIARLHATVKPTKTEPARRRPHSHKAGESLA
jgi:choline dehydrogenase-like flavoprotein